MQTIERGGKPEHRHNALHMNRIHIRCVCFMQEAYSVVSNREEGIISLHFTHNSVLKKKKVIFKILNSRRISLDEIF